MSNFISRWLDTDVGYSFKTSPMAIAAGLVALVCLVGAVFAGFLAPHNPFDLNTLELSNARCRLPGRRQATALSRWAQTTRVVIFCRP